MKRLLALVIAVVMSLMVGCTPQTTPVTGPSVTPTNTGGQHLTVGLTYIPDIQFAPFYVADKRGYFAEEGVSVTLRHHGQGESLLGALAAGQEDVVNAGADEMLQARSQGVDVTTFGLMYQEYPVVLIVGEDSPITSVEELKGHSVGVPGPFGENWFALKALLKEAGLSESDVTIEHIGYTTQAALLTKKVDAVMGFSNNDVLGFADAGLPVRTYPIANNPLKSIALGALDETITEKGPALQSLKRALARAMDDIAADPKAAVQDCFDYLPQMSGAKKIAQAEAVLTATAKLYGEHKLAVAPEQWPAMAQFMREAGLLEGDVDAVQAVNALDK